MYIRFLCSLHINGLSTPVFFDRNGHDAYIDVSVHDDEDAVLDTLHIALFNVLYDLRSHVDVSSWKDVNGPEFEYLGEEERPLSAVGLYKSTPKLLRQGFLCSYAKFRIQDDYGSFARWHFMKRKELEGFAAKHPRIRKKYDLFLKYYRSHGLLKGDKQTKHRNTATKPAAQPNR